MVPDWNVQLASREDAEQIRLLLIELAAWSKTVGTDMWRNPRSLEVIQEEIGRKETFVVREAGRVIACVSLSSSRDPYWYDETGRTIYLHRLAVRRSPAFKGLGAAIILWAQTHLHSHGIEVLRLDTDASNPKLRAYYEKLGFLFRGIEYHRDFKMHFALFEKDLS